MDWDPELAAAIFARLQDLTPAEQAEMRRLIVRALRGEAPAECPRQHEVCECEGSPDQPTEGKDGHEHE